MKRSKVVVPWTQGLHLRPAAKLVQLARTFRASIFLRHGDNTADLRSILSIIALCATLGSAVEIEASGIDEEIAAQAIEELFAGVEDEETPEGDGMPDDMV